MCNLQSHNSHLRTKTSILK